MSKTVRKIKSREKPNDKIYTPLPVALKMIEMCNISDLDIVLDPSKGEGVFYDNFPLCNKHYCEIDEGKDFFDFTEKVDLVIGNPPFSIWDKWIEHTVKITDKFCYIMSVYNLTPPRVDIIHKLGFGITKITLLKVDWWFSPAYIVLFEKNKPSIMECIRQTVMCDICNKRCFRGRTKAGRKYGMNECSNMAS